MKMNDLLYTYFPYRIHYVVENVYRLANDGTDESLEQSTARSLDDISKWDLMITYCADPEHADCEYAVNCFLEDLNTSLESTEAIERCIDDAKRYHSWFTDCKRDGTAVECTIEFFTAFDGTEIDQTAIDIHIDEKDPEAYVVEMWKDLHTEMGAPLNAVFSIECKDIYN